MARGNQRTTWAIGDAVRALDNPESTPDDILAARRWSAITPRNALSWLRGYNAAIRQPGATPVLIDQVR